MKADAQLKLDVTRELDLDASVNASLAAEAATKWRTKVPADKMGVNELAVTLQGKVDLWSERNAVCAAAGAAPGVSSEINELRIES